ncbi:MAG: iron donor protein CyaY [Endozoicomonas sp. (ex Botrylloides leachii)]|nr:iron donor protein CyaY [Endozoicomonas sp. (ex Botrylloides leachii)]
MINEPYFNQLLDDLMMAVEDAVDQLDTNIDYENAGGMLTLTCVNNSQIILSRQPPLRQLWLAAKSGGFHFVFNEQSNQWLCDANDEPFVSLLNRCLSEQSGECITLTL